MYDQLSPSADKSLLDEVDKVLSTNDVDSVVGDKLQIKAKVVKKEVLYTVQEIALTIGGDSETSLEYMVWIIVSTNQDGDKSIRIEGSYPLSVWDDIAKFIKSLKK